jgi:hypothetical protein
MSKAKNDCSCRFQMVPGVGPYYAALRIKVVRDKYGRLWLCPAEVDEEGDLEAQGAWRCGDLTFVRPGRSGETAAECIGLAVPGKGERP